MEKLNYDGVLEAVHYKPDGQVDWVRVYQRKYAIFSDRIILSREAFITQLKAGKRFRLGERILNQGGKFNVSQPVHLVQRDGEQRIVLGEDQATQGELAGVPVI